MRQLLLRFPKHSFACRTYDGVQYSSCEAAALATGGFTKTDETTAAMEELVALRYSAHQLRFALLVLLEQSAHPTALFPKFCDYIMTELYYCVVVVAAVLIHSSSSVL